MIFSMILEVTGSTDIGLQLSGLECVPDLWVGITFAIFQQARKKLFFCDQPGGRSYTLVALFLSNNFSCGSTSCLDTTLNMNF